MFDVLRNSHFRTIFKLKLWVSFFFKLNYESYIKIFGSEKETFFIHMTWVVERNYFFQISKICNLMMSNALWLVGSFPFHFHFHFQIFHLCITHDSRLIKKRQTQGTQAIYKWFESVNSVKRRTLWNWSHETGHMEIASFELLLWNRVIGPVILTVTTLPPIIRAGRKMPSILK